MTDEAEMESSYVYVMKSNCGAEVIVPVGGKSK